MVTRRLTIRILTITLFLLSGCDLPGEREANQKRFTALEGRLTANEGEVQFLKKQRSMDELIRSFDEVAYLTPGSSGYTVLKTNIGSITVSLENVQPYANGSRVTLRFGNVTNAIIFGAKAKIEWGSVDDKGVPNNVEEKSMDFSLKESLAAGAWTNVRVVLENVPPSSLGFIRINNFTHEGIRLSVPS